MFSSQSRCSNLVQLVYVCYPEQHLYLANLRRPDGNYVIFGFWQLSSSLLALHKLAHQTALIYSLMACALAQKRQFIWASRTNTVRPFFKVSPDDKRMLLCSYSLCLESDTSLGRCRLTESISISPQYCELLVVWRHSEHPDQLRHLVVWRLQDPESN